MKKVVIPIEQMYGFMSSGNSMVSTHILKRVEMVTSKTGHLVFEKSQIIVGKIDESLPANYYNVYIGRYPKKLNQTLDFGNPFSSSPKTCYPFKTRSKEESMSQFKRELFSADRKHINYSSYEHLLEHLMIVNDKIFLQCFCKTKEHDDLNLEYSCHGDIIREYLIQEHNKQKFERLIQHIF